MRHGVLRDAQADWTAEAEAQGWSPDALLQSVAQAQVARPPRRETDATARAAELLQLCAGHPPQSHAAADGFTAAFELLQHEAIGSGAVLDIVAACRQAPVSPRPISPFGGQADPGGAAEANGVRNANDEMSGAEALPSALPEPGF